MTDQPSTPPAPAAEAPKIVSTSETAALAVGTNEEAAMTAVSVAKSAAAAAASAAAAAAAEAGVQFEVKRAEAVVEVAVKSTEVENDTDQAENVDGKEAVEGETEDDGQEEDESWYGAGPAEEEEVLVRETLGEDVCQLFIKAVKQLNGAAEDVTRVLKAASSFVIALKRVPEDKQSTVAYGVMSLPHGRALVRYLELESSRSNEVVEKVLKYLQSAAGGGVLNAKAVGDVAGGEASGKEDGEASGKADGEADGEAEGDEDGDAEEDIAEKDGEEEEDVESAWTQLEVARVIFKREGQTLREAECRVTLGELLMACDEGKQASVEFEEAAKLFTDGRRQAECFYKKYLALRNSQKEEAIKALEEAVKVYEGAGASEDVLTDMKQELADMVQVTQLDKKDSDEKQDTAVEVVAVRPKRKRDVEAETATATTVEIATVEETMVSNGAAEGETNGKKARVD